MALETAPEMLPCGRDPLDVVDRARRGRSDAHARTCQYCLATIAAGDDGVRFARPFKDQSIQVPDTLLPSVMKTVWAELRPGRSIPIAAAHGAAFVTEQAITTLLIDALDRLPDLLVHTCRLQTKDDETEPGPDAPGQEGPVLQIEVTAAAAYPVALNGLGEAARAVVAAALWAQFGLQADTIDISFVDVYEQEGALQ